MNKLIAKNCITIFLDLKNKMKCIAIEFVFKYKVNHYRIRNDASCRHLQSPSLHLLNASLSSSISKLG